MSAAVLLTVLAGARARAAALVTEGDWQVSLDTTVSSGLLLRASPVDETFVGIANGGQARTPNADNGTLNFRSNPVAAAPQRITQELDIHHAAFGVFVRATAFYDPIYDSIAPDFKPFPRATVRDLGADARLLDAFVFWNTAFAGHRLSLKLGNQVINWGESLYVSGGINSATPFDVNALQSPGTALREAVLPVPAIDASLGLTANLSIEAFYEFAWIRTRFPPDGSFFSTIDSLSDGGSYGVEDRSFPDSPRYIDCYNLATRDPFGPVLRRGNDVHPPDQGEFGVALRYTAPFMADTEFGLYWEEFGSRTPVAGYLAGSREGALSNERLLLGEGGVTYNSTTRYYADYPAGIRLLGASFSAGLPGGIGLQGEVSHRFGQPLLLATPDSVLQLEAPFLCGLGAYLDGLGLSGPAAPAVAACNQAKADPEIAAAGGIPAFGARFAQFRRYGVTQAQISATKMLPPLPRFGIAGMTFSGEIGVNTIDGFPRAAGILDAPGSTDINSAFAPAATTHGVVQRKGEATQTAAGGVAVLSAQLPHTLPWGILWEPYIAVLAGFVGRDATGAGYFEEGQDAVSIGANFTYLQRLRVNAAYVNHVSLGPSTYDNLTDRDFVSLSVSYEF